MIMIKVNDLKVMVVVMVRDMVNEVMIVIMVNSYDCRYGYNVRVIMDVGSGKGIVVDSIGKYFDFGVRDMVMVKVLGIWLMQIVSMV